MAEQTEGCNMERGQWGSLRVVRRGWRTMRMADGEVLAATVLQASATMSYDGALTTLRRRRVRPQRHEPSGGDDEG